MTSHKAPFSYVCCVRYGFSDKYYSAIHTALTHICNITYSTHVYDVWLIMMCVCVCIHLNLRLCMFWAKCQNMLNFSTKQIPHINVCRYLYVFICHCFGIYTHIYIINFFPYFTAIEKKIYFSTLLSWFSNVWQIVCILRILIVLFIWFCFLHIFLFAGHFLISVFFFFNHFEYLFLL